MSQTNRRLLHYKWWHIFLLAAHIFRFPTKRKICIIFFNFANHSFMKVRSFTNSIEASVNQNIFAISKELDLQIVQKIYMKRPKNELNRLLATFLSIWAVNTTCLWRNPCSISSFSTTFWAMVMKTQPRGFRFSKWGNSGHILCFQCWNNFVLFFLQHSIQYAYFPRIHWIFCHG